ncbi:semialdehyde dehydrogenase [Georgenia yuyongxinii]|uniref:Semialdehyde dehydrogenase n=1 Tax=Georgenia yuyongxinii TaxID=2589797 RepID=A0A5B8BZH6_9MICO|nr:phosphogluconate dehydrogenase C-terminal domain-containing protein [Georgenia yuyongxinii]QDC23829.1 semialdehyde dehydrogenase [Georgenia yuyongxinii]
MTTIALIGAGGKMGTRLGDNLAKTDHEVLHVEPGEAGRARLAERGATAVPADEAVPRADVVVLAVPDNAIGQVSADLIPRMKAGATLIVLDAAAPYAGQVATREDISFVATHPCHPSVFNRAETTPEAQTDYFGGVAGRQDVVIALISGTDADYERAEQVIRAFFAPVVNAHRITVEHMALLEPVLAETTAATCITIIREAMDEAVRRGVPADAARAFILGHIGIELAIIFGEIDSPFSDGALKAIAGARSILFKDDWKRVFDSDVIDASIAEIVGAQSLTH